MNVGKCNDPNHSKWLKDASSLLVESAAANALFCLGVSYIPLAGEGACGIAVAATAIWNIDHDFFQEAPKCK
jgi:hypothetical protein